MISTYALQVGFLSSLTIVKEGLSSTIVNEGLSLTNVYEGLSLTNVYEGSNVCIRINLSLYDRPENCGYRLKCLISALVNLQIILIFVSRKVSKTKPWRTQAAQFIAPFNERNWSEFGMNIQKNGLNINENCPAVNTQIKQRYPILKFVYVIVYVNKSILLCLFTFVWRRA